MEDPPALRLGAFEERSRVNGPGMRAVVWVQGCPREPICAGCYNPGFLDMRGRADVVAPDELARRILAIEGLDGVTFSGGEPFAQAAGLAAVAVTLRASGLTVVVFTGRTLEEIRASADHAALALLDATDLLIDGPYVRDQPSRLPLRSSDNQRLHFLSPHIGPSDVDAAADAVEVTIGPHGDARATGLIDAALLARLRH